MANYSIYFNIGKVWENTTQLSWVRKGWKLLTIEPTNSLIWEWGNFAWTSALSIHGKKTWWIGVLWYLINIFIIIKRFHFIFFIQWVEFVTCLSVNYFYIGEYQGVVLSSGQHQDRTTHIPLRVFPLPRHMSNPPPQHNHLSLEIESISLVSWYPPWQEMYSNLVYFSWYLIKIYLWTMLKHHT